MNKDRLQNFCRAGWRFRATGLALVLTIAGCATPQPQYETHSLNFIADGKTTKQEIIVQLGAPSGQFDHGKILTYRLSNSCAVVPRETNPSGWPMWQMGRLSLVLVFDDADVLDRHSLVKVNK